MPIRLVHDFRDGRDIGSSRSSDARFVHDQSLMASSMNSPRPSLEPVGTEMSGPSASSLTA
jgi:hypothetical protein